MEIRDYLAILRRRLPILVIVPALAGLLALVAFAPQKQQYTTAAKVAVPTMAANATAGAVTVFVANFSEALKTDRVVNTVAAETQLPAHAIKGGLAAVQVGNSNFIQVRYTTTHRKGAEDVPLAAARATLQLLAQPLVADGEAALNVAKQDYANAEKALQDYATFTGVPLPEDTYRQKLADLAGLQMAAATARLDLDIAKANGLDAQVPAAQKAVNDLVPIVTHYRELEATAQQASVAVGSAQVKLQDARGQTQANDAGVVLSRSKVKPVSKITKLGSEVAIVIGLGIIAAVGAIVFLELLAAAHARRAGEQAAPAVQAAPVVHATPVVAAGPPVVGQSGPADGHRPLVDPLARPIAET